MAVTYGFYNSFNEDRKYNAEQLSQIFDGIIHDGVYQTVGDAFVVKPATGSNVTVGTGRAWFNSTWTLNDTILPLTLEKSDVVLNRWDAVVLEVNKNVSLRENKIRVIEGEPGSDPKKPTMVKNVDRFQYPLAYIYRRAGSTGVNKADITNAVGTSETPFVIGVVKSMSIDFIVSKWEEQWSDWFKDQKVSAQLDLDTWYMDTKAEFEDWFNDIKKLLATNDKAELAGKLKELQDKWSDLENLQEVYYPIEDSNGKPILDSMDGTFIGTIKYRKL